MSENQTEMRADAFRDAAADYTDRARAAFRQMRLASAAKRNATLTRLAHTLRQGEIQAQLLKANSEDLSRGRSANLAAPLLDRLTLNEARIEAIARSLEQIAAFPDPVGEVIEGRRLASGVEMTKKRVPLGVVFTIFESRPNVTIDVGALCIKSGNAAILRGGKEALSTNLALYTLLADALRNEGLPEDGVQLVREIDRSCMLALLKRDDRIDLVVPRGGEALIRFVSDNTRIPLVKHDKGVCNLYVDRSADPQMALAITTNAKLQRPSVCNAIENLLIDVEYPHIAELLHGLAAAGADLRGCPRSRQIAPEAVAAIVEPESEYATEYLDNRLAILIVDQLDEAIDFIYRYGSGHSEAIVATDVNAQRRFAAGVDASGVFLNCSTRFNDGGEMGFGAEVGISTGRLHVRGPMGVRDLTTTLYLMQGDGEIRS